MTTHRLSDFDFHPDEQFVRLFLIEQPGVLRFDADALVVETEIDGIVLRHYAFRDEWFKVNLTLGRGGNILETGASPSVPPFAFNCDISTPMLWGPNAAYSVDLFLDVLVRGNGLDYEVTDLDEFERAVIEGLISQHEAHQAKRGLVRLLDLVSRGDLLSFLDDAYPHGPSRGVFSVPMAHVPIADVPLVQPRRRATWFEAG